jgi:hypothetical protein
MNKEDDDVRSGGQRRSEATSTERHFDVAGATRREFKVFGHCDSLFRVNGQHSLVGKLLLALRFGAERKTLVQEVAAFARFAEVELKDE